MVETLILLSAVAGGIRFWRLGGRVDRKVLANVGVMGAAGGLLGALLPERAGAAMLIRGLG